MNDVRELNSALEIIGLLYYHYHPEFLEKDVFIKEINSLPYSVNSEVLYQKINKILKKYMAVFQSNMVVNDGDDFFFGEEDINFIILLHDFLEKFEEEINHDHREDYTNEQVLSIVYNVLQEKDYAYDVLSIDDILSLMKNIQMPSATAWKITIFLQNPASNMKKLISTIKANIPAFQKAEAAIAKPLATMIRKMPDCNYKLVADKNTTTLIPTLIFPLIELLESNYNNVYIGLFVQELYRSGIQKDILPILKVLSDKSRFDILVSLKQSPKCNNDLADQFDLTPATISHHMNALFSLDLVTIEKHGSRVYYVLLENSLQKLVNELQGTFLS